MMKQPLRVVVLLSLLIAGSAVSAAPKGTVTLCHKPGHKGGSTMTVPQPAAGAHFGHGDTPGACQASPSK